MKPIDFQPRDELAFLQMATKWNFPYGPQTIAGAPLGLSPAHWAQRESTSFRAKSVQSSELAIIQWGVPLKMSAPIQRPSECQTAWSICPSGWSGRPSEGRCRPERASTLEALRTSWACSSSRGRRTPPAKTAAMARYAAMVLIPPAKIARICLPSKCDRSCSWLREGE